MTEPAFVGRQAELARLTAHLDLALAGKGQVVFIAGEPGSGKTALLNEFARLAQKAHPDLIIAQGSCAAQSGVGEPYLPFREILAVLTGSEEGGQSQRNLTIENSGRVKKLLARSGLVLIDIAPDLVKLVPVAGSLIAPLGEAVLKQTGVEKRLEAVAERKPDLLTLSEQAVSQEHIFEQCFKLLTTLAGYQPLMIALDDLQWADASSASLLFYLGRRLTGHRVLLVGSFRPDEIAAGRAGFRHPTEQLYTELMRTHGDIVLELTAYDPAQARQFVDAYLDTEPNEFSERFRTALARHTRGHALFVVELMHDIQERGLLVKNEQGRWIEPAPLDWSKLPARVDGVIRSRLDRLNDLDRKVLDTAGVHGETFIAEVVARLMQLPDREVVQRLSSDLSRRHQLVDPGSIERVGGQRISRYSFRHQLLQRFIYHQLDEVERTYLHEDTAAALETLYRDSLDEVAVALAWHYAVAGVMEKAAPYARRAGELAAARYANDDAIAHFSQALTMTPPADLPARLELLLAREAVYGWQGKRAQQAGDLDAMETLAGALRDPEALARVRLRRANYARLTGDYATANAAVEEAVRLAGEAKNVLLEARSYALLGRILLQTGREEEARDWLELALQIAQEQDDLRLQALSLYDLGNTQYANGRHDEATQLYHRAQALYEAVADRKGVVNCLLMCGAMQRQAGNHDDALHTYDEALAACRTLGWRHGESFLLSNLGNTRFVLGDFPRAGQCHDQALAIRRDVADRWGEAVNLDTLGLVAQFEGQTARARALYEDALAIQRALDDRRGEAFTLSHLGLLAEELGELDAASAAQQAALALRERSGSAASAAVDNLAALARLELARGDLVGARSLAGQIEALLADCKGIGVEFPALVYLTLFQVLSAAGRSDAAASKRAADALRLGQALIQAQAAAIGDPVLRQSFLDRGPYNRQLLAAG